MLLREADIEQKVGSRLKEWAKVHSLTVLYLKFSVLGWRGFPDRMVLASGRKIMFVEFKRPGEKPRVLQAKVHSTLSSLGFTVEVHDNADIALATIKAFILPSPNAIEGDKADIGGGRG
jgi:hypothetical protein